MSRRKRSSVPFSLFSFQDIITATTGILILLALVMALSVVVQRSHAVEEPVEVVDTSDLQLEIDSLRAEIESLRNLEEELSVTTGLIVGMTSGELENKRDMLLASLELLEANIRLRESELESSSQELEQELQNPERERMTRQLADLQQRVAETREEIERLRRDNRVVYNFRQTASPPWLIEISGGSIKVAKAGVSGPAREFSTAREVVSFAEGLSSSDQYFVLLVKPSGIEKYGLIRSYLEKAGAEIGVELLAEVETAVDLANGAGF